jgi:hypothetical protein
VTGFIVGAYAAADPAWTVRTLAGFYASLAALPGVAGLELPAAQLEALARDRIAARALPEQWRYEVTSLPVTMTELKRDPGFGLASVSARGREEAVAAHDRIRTSIRRFHDLLGRPAVDSVALVSAPGPADADPRAAWAAFAGSLTTLAGWNWDGAALAVEHCDARRPGQVAAKGFLALDDEFAAVTALPGPGSLAPVSLVINWGRSAIEQRNPDLPVQHAAHARQRGMLRGVVLSGCADTSSAWGPPWADTHLPPSGVVPPGGAPHGSLLTGPRMKAFLRASGPDSKVGVKVAVRPRDADHETRRRFIAASVEAVQQTWSAAHQPT